MSRAVRDQYDRRYHVTDSRTNPKGFTEYKFISKKNPQDVKEIVVWKRYSDFKKLHGELSYTHRNLFQRTQEFPPFPRAQVFGRFEAPVIEERRQAAEDTLRFTVSIPALNNSPQLKEFFRTGEVTMRSDGPDSGDAAVLPPPLIPEPVRSSSTELQEELDDFDELETQVLSDVKDTISSSEPSQFDLLFDLNEDIGQTGEEETASPTAAPKTLAPDDLALFDPCYAEDGALLETESSLNLLSLRCEVEEPAPALPLGEEDGALYLSLATAEVQKAMEKETAGDYPEAFRLFRNAVDVLLKGVKDDRCPDRRDVVRRRTAEYLHHAEQIFQDHMSGSTE
ncbi:sorting nexin-15 isoform X2 [Bufo gargarizans]|uniref:sorting nexin-15 isoform X2 n=1 Tax=Bufo gargarizans TaxID=30331 RepID=UPI001CF3B764|nr:sorting nexin-15 isoform X2 [Bufo gargarizans]